MEWKSPGNGVSEGLVIENRTAEPKHIEVDCQTSKSTVFSEVARLAPGESTPYSDLPERMIEVNARAADGPKGKSMFDPEEVPGAIVVQVMDTEVVFETTTNPYDPTIQDYTPSDNSNRGDDDDKAGDTSDAETAGGNGETSHDASGEDSGSTTTATEQSVESTTHREERDQTSVTADRDAPKGSSNADSSVSQSQTTQSRSAGETPAQSESGRPESASSATNGDTAGRTTARETSERTGKAGQQSSTGGTSPSEAGGTDGDKPGTGEVDKYLSGSEAANKVLAGDSRLFAVTDRRILDVTQSTSASGASIEEVESTLFSYVTGVDISIKGPTTNVDLTQRVIGAAIAIAGLLVAIASLVADAGDVTAVGSLVGLILIGVGVWIYYNASERVPGGIRIQFTHTGGSRGSGDSYLLPEGHGDTAREVVQQLGSAHAPDPEPDEIATTSASPNATAGAATAAGESDGTGGSTGSGGRVGRRRGE